MQSGVVGLVDQSKVQVVNLNSAKSYSNYYADGSSIIHRICMDMTTPGYGGSVMWDTTVLYEDGDHILQL